MAAADGERAPERLVQHVRPQQRAVEIDGQDGHFGAPHSHRCRRCPTVQGSGHDVLGSGGFFLVFALADTCPADPCLGQPFLDWRGVDVAPDLST
jgi:hypothetical protein